jgi:hypothetical protein
MDLAELCQSVDILSVSERSVDLIRAELSPYRSIDHREHLAAVRVQQRHQLDALAAGMVLSGDALEAAADLARTRASQDVEIDALIGAFHLGDQVLWEALRAAAPEGAAVLADAAALMLAQLHALTMTLAAAHAEASQILHGRRLTVSQRLIELLDDGTVDAEAAAHAEALGLSDRAQSLALVWRSPRPEADALELARAVAAAGVTSVVAHLPSGESVLVCQGTDPEQLHRRAAPCLGERAGGIGLPRAGLRGAAQSIADARLAAGAAARLPVPAVLRLDECWLDAVVLAERDRLSVIFAPIAEVARTRPHLAAAVTAFAESGMQVTRAAQRLNLHPNSLSYRLDRWGSLTGWHPRTFDGLRRSLAAIQSLTPARPVAE